MRGIWKKIGGFLISQSGRMGTGRIGALVGGILLLFIGLVFIGEFSGIMGNATWGGDSGGIGETLFDIAVWLVPALAVGGLILYGIKRLLGR